MVARGIGGANIEIMGRTMSVLNLLHRSLNAIGKVIGQLTVFILAMGLWAAPVIALVIGSLFTAAEISSLIGGGVWLTLSLFWVFVGLISFYATPHASPQISAAFMALLKSN